MVISAVEAIALRIKRDQPYLGPLPRGASGEAYFLRPPYRTLYSAYYETLFVKITTHDGLVGWGEALAPVAPEAVGTLVVQLLSPILQGQDPLAVDTLWNRMYGAMRDRGHYGGFMLDA